MVIETKLGYGCDRMRVLRRLLPGASFAIAFDPAMERQESSDEGK
jgi:hypothetical protein